MKAKKLIMTAVSLAASAILAVSAGAYVTKVSSPSTYLETSQDEWAIIFPEELNAPIEGISKIEIVASITGGQEKYEQEKADGLYDDGNETPFVDFEGHIGIGASIEGGDNKYWYAFNYKTLAETSGGSAQAAIKSLGGGKYMFTSTFGSVKVHSSSNSDFQIRFRDWGNKSPNYSLTVEEMFVYGADGNVVIHADASGKISITAPAQTTAATTTAAETTTTTTPETTATTTTTTEATTTTTTAEETATTETSAEETSETETSASETSETTTTTTTKAEETTTAETTEAQTSAGQTEETAAETTKSVKKTTDSGFTERDTVLIIVGIAAGAIILAVILYLVSMMFKKKK